MKKVLGIDVGGSKIQSGLVNRNFKIAKIRTVKTNKKNLSEQLIKIISSYKDFDAIGLAVPGRVLADGRIVRLPNIKDFKSPNLKTVLEKKFHRPIRLINDAKAFTLAEATLGAGKKFDTVVGITLGTGIGCGLVKNKQIYLGKNRFAGEIGHILINRGLTLEQLMQKGPRFDNRKQAKLITSMLLSLVIRTLDPDIIVFGGGRMDHSWSAKMLKDSMKEIFANRAKTQVAVAQLKYPGIVGTVLPFFYQRLKR